MLLYEWMGQICAGSKCLFYVLGSLGRRRLDLRRGCGAVVAAAFNVVIEGGDNDEDDDDG